jgi:hypothetical protein
MSKFEGQKTPIDEILNDFKDERMSKPRQDRRLVTA